MAVELTPNGTYGTQMPKIPRPFSGVFWKLFSFAVRLRGLNLLDLTTVGARTGREHTVPLSWFPDHREGWLIVGSHGGSRRHPAWVFNMASHPDKVWIRIGRRKWHVQPESLQGAEREAAFRRIASLEPAYAGYEKKTDRVIPVVRLKPDPREV